MMSESKKTFDKELKIELSNLKKQVYALQNILDYLPGLIYWKDLSGRYLGCNQFSLDFAQSVGLIKEASVSEILGKTDRELFNKETAERYEKGDKAVITRGEVITDEETLFLPDGRVVNQITTKRPLHDDEGNIIGIVGNTIDVTKQRSLEERIRLQQKLRETEAREARFKAMSSMGAMIAHELRTPLTSLGMASVSIQKLLPRLIEGFEKSVEAGQVEPIRQDQLSALKRSIENMGHSVGYAQTTISAVLASFSESPQGEHFKTKPANLVSLINKAVKEYPYDLGEQKLVCVKQVDEVSVLVEEQMLVHVFHNIIKNALHIIHEEGKGKITLWTERQNDFVLVFIEDTAKGIDPETLRHIFDAFYTTKEQSAASIGIGLYFCKVVLEKMDAEITCESTLGKFTRFVLRLRVLCE